MFQSINVYVTMQLALLLILTVPVINEIGAQTTIYHDRVIHVHNNGNNSESCLIGQDMRKGKRDQYCKTLEYVEEKLRNSGSRNMTIIFESKIKLRSTVTFRDHEDLTIQGRSKDTKLSCNCDKVDSDIIGISFIRIINLKIKGFNIRNCCGKMQNYSTSVLIEDCSSATIENSQIHNNHYSSGLIMINPSGAINVRNCIFSDNGNSGNSTVSSTGAGLHIEFTRHSVARAMIEISGCDFKNNTSPEQKVETSNATHIIPLDVTKKRKWKRQNNGGGMAIVLQNGTSFMNIRISDCNFVNNQARWGGGLSIYAQKGTLNNTVFVSNSNFTKNSAQWGGGGIHITLGQLEEKSQNLIHFEDVIFETNRAILFGGGTSVSALMLNYAPQPGEILIFINCTWYRNVARYSPAVDLSPYKFELLGQGYSPSPLFKDIKIQSNHGTSFGQNHVIYGAFAITRFIVHFQGNIEFADNQYTALYLISGKAVFVKCSVKFYRNLGIRGGAISIHSFSSLVINDNSHFMFINNSATREGGGIYYVPIDRRECFSGQTCFLDYGGSKNNVDTRNISFKFDGNKATLSGTSIYSESIYTCYYAYFEYTGGTKNLTKFFDRIGDFQFDLNSTAIPNLATAVRKMELNHTSPLKTQPGKPLHLPLTMYDEFDNAAYTEVGLRVEDNKRVSLESHYITNNKTHIFGAPNQNITLILSTPLQLCSINYKVNITLLPCPPGFYYNLDYKRCWCSSDNKSHSYPALIKCNYVHFTVFIKSGYWIGYNSSNVMKESTLYTALYPSIFNNSNTSGLLEITANSEDLSDFMCGNSREGILCGTCKKGYSAYYRSNGITCGANELCRYGILFYILSDLTPTVIFFTIVMISGLSFSSGTLNGFVFFSQVVDIFSQDLIFSQNYGGKEEKLLNILQAGHQLIYGIFNIDFFSIFPFCLWEGATILDALAFKYVTTLFALILIILIVVTINSSLTKISCCSRATQCNSKVFRWRRDSSVIHGISTFLIICYGQYTRVSFFILSRTQLHGMHGVEPISVTYYGGLPYLGKTHFFYAIPAILCTTFLVVLPPLFLLLYPLIPHLLSLCGLNEHPVVNKALQILCINRLLPLFDSFQSCYKDKMRFYAGLYFLYRVAAFLAYMHSEILPPVFLAVLILGIHSVLQPYKSWKYNAIDGLLFLNIAIINSITEMIKSSLITNRSKNILRLKQIQLAFIYLPMVSLLLIILVKVGRKLKIKVVCQDKLGREPPEPSIIGVNRSRGDESEIALQPVNQLQVPLLNRFQYAL